jgi:hypothetical protein
MRPPRVASVPSPVLPGLGRARCRPCATVVDAVEYGRHASHIGLAAFARSGLGAASLWLSSVPVLGSEARRSSMGAIWPFEPADGAYGAWSNPIWFSTSQNTPPRATENRDDAHQVDPEPAGLRAATAPTPASWSVARMRPGSLAEARRYYGAAHSAAWMHHAWRAAGGAMEATAVVLKSVIECPREAERSGIVERAARVRSLARRRGDGHSNLCGLRDRERRFTGWSVQIVNYPIGE